MAILFLIVFIDLVGFGVVIPLLPYYALHFNATPLEVTLMMACYSLAQFFSSPFWGRMSDKLGRRPILLVSLGASVLSYLWLGVADALWMLFAARLLAGAGAGNIAAAQAYITDSTAPENRAKGMGMIGAAFGLGFTVGPAFGGLLAGSDPTAAALSRQRPGTPVSRLPRVMTASGAWCASATRSAPSRGCRAISAVRT